MQKIDEELVKNFDLFEHEKDQRNLSDDLDKMLTRIDEDMEEMKCRLHEKSSELNDFNVQQDEYENCIENISKTIQIIETKIRQLNMKLTFDLLKVNKIKIQFFLKQNFLYRI